MIRNTKYIFYPICKFAQIFQPLSNKKITIPLNPVLQIFNYNVPPDMSDQETLQSTEQELIAVRKEKLQKLYDLGVEPFGSKFPVTTTPDARRKL